MSRDKRTTFSTEQAITTAIVSEFVNSFPTDEARNLFKKRPQILKVLVTTSFTGLASGIRFEFRIDTAASLASGSQIVLAASPIILPANLSAGDLYEIAIGSRRVPAGYDFWGAFYVPVSEAASAGAVTAWLDDASEQADVVDA